MLHYNTGLGYLYDGSAIYNHEMLGGPLKVYFFDSIYAADQKAAAVPQPAMIIATTSKTPSRKVRRPANEAFASTGPMTQIRNAENDPRNAMIASKFGMAMDTMTARTVTSVRSNTVKIRFRTSRL